MIPKPHRGFAFVTFNDPEVTKKIIRVSDFVINGVSVCVSAASPKEQQNQPPSQSQGPPPSGSYGYGYGYAGRGPPRDPPGYGPVSDEVILLLSNEWQWGENSDFGIKASDIIGTSRSRNMTNLSVRSVLRHRCLLKIKLLIEYNAAEQQRRWRIFFSVKIKLK